MKILELQPRLQAIADMVPAGAVVADIVIRIMLKKKKVGDNPKNEKN